MGRGQVIKGTAISVNRWYPEDAKLFFLTDVMCEHIDGLTSSWNKPIYTSILTAKLLKLKLPFLSPFILPLDFGTSYVLEFEVDSIPVAVRLFDANYCPGAVMLLFEGAYGTILYTGDFRYHPNLLSEIGNIYDIETLYFDNTYCTNYYNFPVQSEAIDIVITHIKPHIDLKRIMIACSPLVKKELLINIHNKTGRVLNVSSDRMKFLQALDIEFLACVQEDKKRKEIYIINISDVSRDTVKKWTKEMPTEILLLTGKYVGEDKKPYRRFSNVCPVPYSSHSSFNELVQFMKVIKPKNIMPIIVSPIKAMYDKNQGSLESLSLLIDYVKADLGENRQKWTENCLPEYIEESDEIIKLLWASLTPEKERVCNDRVANKLISRSLLPPQTAKSQQPTALPKNVGRKLCFSQDVSKIVPNRNEHCRPSSKSVNTIRSFNAINNFLDTCKTNQKDLDSQTPVNVKVVNDRVENKRISSSLFLSQTTKSQQPTKLTKKSVWKSYFAQYDWSKIVPNCNEYSGPSSKSFNPRSFNAKNDFRKTPVIIEKHLDSVTPVKGKVVNDMVINERISSSLLPPQISISQQPTTLSNTSVRKSCFSQDKLFNMVPNHNEHSRPSPKSDNSRRCFNAKNHFLKTPAINNFPKPAVTNQTLPPRSYNGENREYLKKIPSETITMKDKSLEKILGTNAKPTMNETLIEGKQVMGCTTDLPNVSNYQTSSCDESVSQSTSSGSAKRNCTTISDDSNSSIFNKGKRSCISYHDNISEDFITKPTESLHPHTATISHPNVPVNIVQPTNNNSFAKDGHCTDAAKMIMDDMPTMYLDAILKCERRRKRKLGESACDSQSIDVEILNYHRDGTYNKYIFSNMK